MPACIKGLLRCHVTCLGIAMSRFPPLLSAGVLQPCGYERGGAGTQVDTVATKIIGPSGTDYVPRHLHLNVIWFQMA